MDEIKYVDNYRSKHNMKCVWNNYGYFLTTAKTTAQTTGGGGGGGGYGRGSRQHHPHDIIIFPHVNSKIYWYNCNVEDQESLQIRARNLPLLVFQMICL